MRVQNRLKTKKPKRYLVLWSYISILPMKCSCRTWDIHHIMTEKSVRYKSQLFTLIRINSSHIHWRNSNRKYGLLTNHWQLIRNHDIPVIFYHVIIWNEVLYKHHFTTLVLPPTGCFITLSLPHHDLVCCVCYPR